MTSADLLPNHRAAIIETGKLEDYALNPTNERGRQKARVFERVLGFTRDNWQQLRQAILDELSTCAAAPQSETPFGRKFTVVIPITGPNGRTADITTVWQYDRLASGALSDTPRLVTLYLR